jgi:ABC-2 type transport system permease protein
MRRALAIAWKDLLCLARDPEFLILQLLYPIFGLVVFGCVFSVTVRGIRLEVRDLDATPASRRFVRELEASGYFRATERESFDGGDAPAILTLGAGIGRDVRRGRAPSMSLELDGTDLASARAAESYVLGSAASLERPERAPRSARPVARYEPSVVTWFNPELRDPDYFLPSVLAILALGSPAVLTALSLVRERRTGSWVAMRLAPVSDLALFTGRLLPFMLEGLVVAATTFAVAHFAFDLPFRGGALLLAAVTFMNTLTGVSFGIVIFSISQDEDSAWQYIQLYVLVPALVLSGAIYPIASLSRPVQVLSCFSPIRWYLEFVRGSCLKGAGLEDLARPVVALVAFACLTVVFALTLLRRARQVET